MNRKREFQKYLAFVQEPDEDFSLEGAVSAGSHYDEAALMAFCEGEAPPAERARMEIHLAACPACRELLEDVRTFCEPAKDGEPDLSEFEIRRGWKQLRTQLPFESRQQAGFMLGSRAAILMAASLLLTTSLAGFFAYRLWQARDQLQGGLAQHKMETRVLSAPPVQNPPLAQALPNAPVFDLTIPPQTRSSRTERAQFTAVMPENASLFTLRIRILSDRYAAYAIEFADSTGASLWKQPDLKPDQRAAADSRLLPEGQEALLSVAIPRQPLKPGRYLFKFYGQRGAETLPLETIDWIVR